LSPKCMSGASRWYAGGYATLDAILQKIIDYENEAGPTPWRKNVLLPMSFSAAYYDGAPLAEQMMDDYLDSAGFSSWTQYQQGSVASAIDSIYPSSEELRGGNVVRDRWAANDFGLVVWWGHGNETGAYVGFDPYWDGVLFDTSQVVSLDDDHPAFTYQNSCTNGYPEDAGNLQYTLLQHGAVAAVSASRVSWYNPDEGKGEFASSTTNAGIGYEYTKRLTEGQSAGEALYNAKSSMSPTSDSRLMNYYDFNLYGDPVTFLLPAPIPMAYLPLVVRSSPVISLVNGDFEQGHGAGWGESSNHGRELIVDSATLPATPHSGSWGAWLGGNNNENSSLSQLITIPSSNPLLTFWFWIDSQDYCGHDFVEVLVGGTYLLSYTPCTTTTTGGWVQQDLDLGAYSGQTLVLEFVITTDSTLNSNIFIDDITFEGSGGK
jgi:hypothetical protein